jgi:L,D-transpeptidase ErfK/SrfK
MNRPAPILRLPCLALLAWLPSAQAQLYSLPPDGGDLVGREETINVTTEETLADVARQYKVGHVEIRLANPDVEFWLVRPGTEVILPKRHILPQAKRDGLVLNVPEMRLYYFPRPCAADADCPVLTYPVSIGQQDWNTPLGTTRVTAKVPNPTWRPPESIRKEAAANGKYLAAEIPPGPDNPLGAYALYLDLPGYRIHGTNRPFGVGMRVTHGCVRMYPEDIESLYDMVRVGTKVQIVNQPVKFGWADGTLFMEVHPPLDEDTEGIALLKDRALAQLEQIAADRPFELYGREFLRALDGQRGMPVAISKGGSTRQNSVEPPAGGSTGLH